MAQIDWADGIRLEHEVSMLIREQERSGIYFDVPKAHHYIKLLESMKSQKYDCIRPHLGFDVINLEKKDKETGQYSCVRKIANKNGTYTTSVLNHFPDPSICCAAFSRVQFEEPTISKRQLIVKQLLKMGWQPEEFTEKGFPKLTNQDGPVETLEQVGAFGKDLSLWYVYNHRQSQINGFLPHVREDQRISAQMNTCATNTFRAAHKVVANIPRPSSVFGKEMRGLFRVSEGRAFVGADASGLELRILAHHMNDADYTEQILSGDIHTYNQQMAGLPDRNSAKTFIYAFLYGAGDAKIGSIIGGSAKQGKLLKDTFFQSIPALASLADNVRRFASAKGYLPSVDKRKIFVRSFEGKLLLHTALNCLLQANGSIVVKRAMVIASNEIKRRKLDAFQILFYHDEVAYDSAPECAEEVGQIIVDSMRLAGEYYHLRIPIAGEYKIGKDWSIH